MAVVNSGLRGISDQTNKRLQELQQGYNQSAAVQQAQQQLQQAQANKPGAYQPGQAVQQAQQQLQQIQASKPQGYNSKFEAQLDSILQQIQNPQQFKYEFNGDNLFKSYQDLYTQQGKQASMDAQGQAAALTGGYGNSYGQIVGQQQYQQNLLDLYNVGLDLRDRAYQQYVNDQNNQKDIYNILMAADEAQYGRYRDTVGDWQNERNYATDLYNTERNFDYGQHRDAISDWENERDFLANQLNNERNFDYNAYMDMLNATMNQANMENKDYWTGEEFTEGQRQFNENLAENQRQADLDEAYRQATLAENIRQADLDEAYRQAQFNWQQETDARDYEQSVRENEQKYAYNYVMDILSNGQMPSVDLLMAAGLSQEDAQKLIAQLQTKSTGTKTTEEPAGEKDESFYDASQRIVASNPQTKATVQQQKAKKEVTQTINSGKLPSTDLISKAGMTTADVLKQAVQQTVSSKSSVLKAGNEIKKSNSALKSKLAKNP